MLDLLPAVKQFLVNTLSISVLKYTMFFKNGENKTIKRVSESIDSIGWALNLSPFFCLCSLKRRIWKREMKRLVVTVHSNIKPCNPDNFSIFCYLFQEQDDCDEDDDEGDFDPKVSIFFFFLVCSFMSHIFTV